MALEQKKIPFSFEGDLSLPRKIISLQLLSHFGVEV